MIRLLDTNAVLYLLGGQLAEPLPAGEYLISVITEMELFSYPSLAGDSEARIRDFLNDVSIVGLTDAVKEQAIGLRRKYGLKLPDAIVAGTALVFEAELVTNDGKLERIPDLRVRKLVLRV